LGKSLLEGHRGAKKKPKHFAAGRNRDFRKAKKAGEIEARYRARVPELYRRKDSPAWGGHEKFFRGAKTNGSRPAFAQKQTAATVKKVLPGGEKNASAG